MFRFPPLTPFVKKLLIGLFGLFVAGAVLEGWLGVPMYSWLALRPGDVGIHWIWQIFTHVLVMPPVPGAEISVLISLVFIWWMLAPFEERYGAQRAAQLCVAAALSAALPVLLVGFVLPGSYVAGPGPIMLAAISASVAMIPPDAQISFFGVFPMKAKQVIWVVIGLSVLSFLLSKNALDLVADLGAVGGGIAFVRWMHKPPRKRIFQQKKRKKAQSGPSLRLVRDDSQDDNDDDNDEDPKRWLN